MQKMIITKKGLSLMSKAVGNTSSITFTKLCTSDKDYSNATIEDIEVLENIRQETGVANVTVMDDGQVEVIGAFSNENVTLGYYVKALGIYAKGDDGVEILYGVSIETEMPDYVAEYLGKTVTGISYRLYIRVDNSENVTLEVNAATVPTMIQVQDIEERVIYIEENMITPEEKTAIQHIVSDGISTNDIVDVDFEKHNKPTLPVVTTQGIVRNYDCFDINTVNTNVLESSINTFTSVDKSYSEDVVTYVNGVGGTFQVKSNGEIVVSSNITNMNIDLNESITFENKHGNKYITYILQKLNTNTSQYEDYIVGKEVLILANNDNNLTVAIEKRVVDEALDIGTYKILRKYRNDKGLATYTVNSGSIALYSDETMDEVTFKDEFIKDFSQTKDIARNVVNENLLINSNFKVSELVNQRGKTTYSGDWGYFADMLECYAGHEGHYVSLEGEYLQLITTNGSYTCIRQKIESLEPGVYTLSARVKGTAGERINLYMSGTGTTKEVFTNGSWQDISVSFELSTVTTTSMASLWFYKVNGNGICDIEYMKLERGDTGTPFVDDNMATKLAKCQRYLYKLGASTCIYRASVIYSGDITFTIKIPDNFRLAYPSFIGTTETTNIKLLNLSGTQITGFTFSGVSGSSIKGFTNIVATKSLHGLTDASLQIIDTLISAEL